MFCECNISGIWDVDLEPPSCIAAQNSASKILRKLRGQGSIFADDSKVFISEFIEFQYPRGLQESNPAHKNVISQLSKYQLFEVLKRPFGGLQSPFKGAKYMYKDKEKDNKGGVGGKKKYAEFVMMTEKEGEKLRAEFGEEGSARLVEILNNYKGSSGKKYKSDYLAIKNWVVDRYLNEKADHEKRTTKSRAGNSSSDEELMRGIASGYERGIEERRRKSGDK